MSVKVILAAQSQLCTARVTKEGEIAIRRRRALRRLDMELEKRNYKAAVSLVKQLHAHPSRLLRGFGAAAASPKVSRNVSSLDKLKLTGETETSSLQSLVDFIVHSVKCSLQFQLQEEETEVCQQEEETEVFLQDSGKSRDEEGYNSLHEDHQMCIQHEAGHFLVGYMFGVLPRKYIVPCMEDLLQDNYARGRVDFLGFEFLRDVGMATTSNKNFSRGKLDDETLRRFTCTIFGGLAAEHLLFGYSELLHSDVEMFYRVLNWLGYTENETDYEARQAAAATVLILSSHGKAQCRLAEAMALGRSVGSCIESIESALDFDST